MAERLIPAGTRSTEYSFMNIFERSTLALVPLVFLAGCAGLGGGAPGGSSDDDVVDAEVVEDDQEPK